MSYNTRVFDFVTYHQVSSSKYITYNKHKIAIINSKVYVICDNMVSKCAFISTYMFSICRPTRISLLFCIEACQSLLKTILKWTGHENIFAK